MRTLLERLLDVSRIGVTTHEYDSGFRQALLDTRRGLETILYWHRYVQQYEIRLKIADQINSGLAIISFGNDRAACFYDSPYHATKENVVLGNNHSAMLLEGDIADLSCRIDKSY